MAVILEHATHGTLTLPSPALNSSIDPDPNQSLAWATDGTVRTFRYGPTRYQFRRKFEFLSEAELKAAVAWFELIGWMKESFSYKFTDPRFGLSRQKEIEDVKIIQPPLVQRASLNIHTLDIIFEAKTAPDFATPAVVPP